MFHDSARTTWSLKQEAAENEGEWLRRNDSTGHTNDWTTAIVVVAVGGV